MKLRHLRYALELGRTRHFTQAAERLGIAQPALSQAIAALEKELAVALFVRTSRRVQPTEAGARFLERAERILGDLDDLQAEMQEHAVSLRGRVTVATMVFFGATRLPPVVAEFARLHPGVELAIESRSKHDSLEGLRRGTLDAALLHVAEAADYPELAFHVLERDEIAAALAAGHPLAGRERLAFAELRDEPFIMFEPGSTMHDALRTLTREAGFAPRAIAHSQNINLVRAMVSAGVGVSIGPRSYLLSAGPPVAAVPLAPSRSIAISLVTGGSAEANPAARALVALLRARFDTPSLSVLEPAAP